MRGKIVVAALAMSLFGGFAAAQDAPAMPGSSDVYCSGLVTTESVPRDVVLVSGEQSANKIVFDEGDEVYISKGGDQGVKVGDEFSVVRPVTDTIRTEWTKWQHAILGKMGTVWEDEGRLKVTVVRPDIAIATIERSCNSLQRGDVILPFSERPAPPLKPAAKFDNYAPADGKPMAMVITGKKFQSQIGSEDIVYVNLGASQGVKVGDYFRIFRYQGTEHDAVYIPHRAAFDEEGVLGPTYGFGKAPAKYNWSNVPRENLGEGVVLRTGPNSATVLITFTRREVFAGDYVEIE